MGKIDITAACCDLGVHVNGSNLGPEILLNNIDKTNINIITKLNYLCKIKLNIKN